MLIGFHFGMFVYDQAIMSVISRIDGAGGADTLLGGYGLGDTLLGGEGEGAAA